MTRKEKKLLRKYIFETIFGIMMFISLMIFACIKAGIYVL